MPFTEDALGLLLEHPSLAAAAGGAGGRHVATVAESNLRQPLRRCAQLQREPCARFPACLCGSEALENTLLDLGLTLKPGVTGRPRAVPGRGRPVPPPRPDPPGPPRAPAIALPAPRAPERTRAVAGGGRKAAG